MWKRGEDEGKRGEDEGKRARRGGKEEGGQICTSQTHIPPNTRTHVAQRNSQWDSIIIDSYIY
jgi:hypothetical protein